MELGPDCLRLGGNGCHYSSKWESGVEQGTQMINGARRKTERHGGGGV